MPHRLTDTTSVLYVSTTGRPIRGSDWLLARDRLPHHVMMEIETFVFLVYDQLPNKQLAARPIGSPAYTAAREQLAAMLDGQELQQLYTALLELPEDVRPEISATNQMGLVSFLVALATFIVNDGITRRLGGRTASQQIPDSRLYDPNL